MACVAHFPDCRSGYLHHCLLLVGQYYSEESSEACRVAYLWQLTAVQRSLISAGLLQTVAFCTEILRRLAPQNDGGTTRYHTPCNKEIELKKSGTARRPCLISYDTYVYFRAASGFFSLIGQLLKVVLPTLMSSKAIYAFDAG